MKKKVCFAGKGGVGKSSCIILFLKYIIANFPDSKKLIIDADPDANILDLLNESLGLYGTIGGEIIELKKKIDRKEVPPNVSERKLIEETILKNIKKNREFDVVKSIIDTLEEIYQFVIIDSPAGLEFFSRKTAKDIDDLILVTDMSKMSFHTIERLMEIKEEVEAQFQNIWVLVNKYNANSKAPFIERIEEFSNGEARLLGFLDYNPEIQRFYFETKSLLEISKDNPIYQQAQEVFSSLFN
ncbi:MAG: AAA family ATPase [Candidatus Lokiarchaeota archaeon]|nr:AAA family ATPase [Candidatus Lokiarchaeota archaeon]